MFRSALTAALIPVALLTAGCARNRDVPVTAAPARLTSIGVNTYLWRAAIDTLSFAPLVNADSNGGVIVTDWYANPQTPGERVKLTVSILEEGAALVFVSPVYPTRSHPGAAALGMEQAARIAGMAGVPAVALGGVSAAMWPRLREAGFAGWAGIDAWVGDG